MIPGPENVSGSSSSLAGGVAAALDAFPHSWRATVLPGAPLIAPARQFIFPQSVPGEEDALHRGALFLEVRPGGAAPFLATCALGFRDPSLPSGIWSCPSPGDLLAVAGGYAYRIDTTGPQTTELLEQRPVTAIAAAPERGLLLLAGFHDILALGRDGVCWRSGRVSWEGVTLGAIADGQLYGTGWDMFADTEVPFTVDLGTGAHQGGGYRPKRP